MDTTTKAQLGPEAAACIQRWLATGDGTAEFERWIIETLVVNGFRISESAWLEELCREHDVVHIANGDEWIEITATGDAQTL